jgi:hypothetical protein
MSVSPTAELGKRHSDSHPLPPIAPKRRAIQPADSIASAADDSILRSVLMPDPAAFAPHTLLPVEEEDATDAPEDAARPEEPAGPADEERPQTPTDQPITAIDLESPEATIPTPVRDPKKLRSPMDYHFAKHIDGMVREDGTLTKNGKKFRKSLDGKAAHTIVAPGSAERDPDRIKRERRAPDEKGIIPVTPSRSGATRRLWRVHDQLNPNGENRLFPFRDPAGTSMVTLTGPDTATLFDEFAAAKTSDPTTTFASVLAERVTPPPPRRPTPSPSERAATPSSSTTTPTP